MSRFVAKSEKEWGEVEMQGRCKRHAVGIKGCLNQDLGGLKDFQDGCLWMGAAYRQAQ